MSTLMAVRLGVPTEGPHWTPGHAAPRGVWAAGKWPCPSPRTCGHVTSRSRGDTADRIKPRPQGPSVLTGGRRVRARDVMRRKGPHARDAAPPEAGKGRKRLSLEPPCSDIRTPVVTLCLIRLSRQHQNSPSVAGREPSPAPSCGTAAPMVGGPRAGEKAELQGDPAAQTPGPASVPLLSPQSLGSN